MTDLTVSLQRKSTFVSGALRVGHDASNGRFWVGALTAIVCSSLLLLTQLYLELAISLGILVGTLAWVADGWVVAARTVRIESQLADALDLMGSSVAAGVGLVEALDGVVREVQGLLKPVLTTAAERMRLGDDPQRVFSDAQMTLPLPAFRLLTHYLSVQWQSGGTLAPGLYSIAETVRDRVNLGRRVQGQTAEARISVLGVLGVVYGIALLAWTNNPDRVEAFLGSTTGGGAAAACVLLQAVGIVWMARLTRIEV